MKNKQAFFVNKMWNPFMLIEQNIINGEIPEYPINDPPPKKNNNNYEYWASDWNLNKRPERYEIINGDIVGVFAASPTQHINQPNFTYTNRGLEYWLGEGEE